MSSQGHALPPRRAPEEKGPSVDPPTHARVASDADHARLEREMDEAVLRTVAENRRVQEERRAVRIRKMRETLLREVLDLEKAEGLARIDAMDRVLRAHGLRRLPR